MSPARHLNFISNGSRALEEVVPAPAAQPYSKNPGAISKLSTVIQETAINALLDSGANFSVMSAHLVDRLGLTARVEYSDMSYATATGD